MVVRGCCCGAVAVDILFLLLLLFDDDDDDEKHANNNRATVLNLLLPPMRFRTFCRLAAALLANRAMFTLPVSFCGRAIAANVW